MNRISFNSTSKDETKYTNLSIHLAHIWHTLKIEVFQTAVVTNTR
ncbi:hypothetical protein OAJ14_05745 [Polaribacter sp.]|nr:hypothetical protein [Polaribacter sp.]